MLLQQHQTCGHRQARQAFHQRSHAPTTSWRHAQSVRPHQRSLHIARAAANDDDLEERLAKLRKAKGATPFGEGAKANRRGRVGTSTEAPAKKEYSYAGEVLHYEGNPSRGDLAVNVALGFTLLWLPLTIAAVTRALYVTYRITDKRVTVTTSAPWKTESVSIPYEEVKSVVVIGRGVGLWGDMVITLRNSDKVELRSIEKFAELRDYIIARKEAVQKPEFTTIDLDGPPAPARTEPKGFA